jgi:uncharacterized phage protein (TIGR01671 family)
MREIKFRAWDKLKHSIVDVACVNWVDGYALLWKRTGSARSTYGVELDSIELMQYTGLKDKNGVEIYEGDICREQVNQYIWLYLITTVSSMGNNLFAVCRWRNFTITDGESIMGSYPENGNWNYISITLEIIGNIYENPELLSEVKND